MICQQIVPLFENLSEQEIYAIMAEPLQAQCTFYVNKQIINTQDEKKYITAISQLSLRGGYLLENQKDQNVIISGQKLGYNLIFKSNKPKVNLGEANQVTVQPNIRFRIDKVHSFVEKREKQWAIGFERVISLQICSIDFNLGKTFLDILMKNPIIFYIEDLKSEYKGGKVIPNKAQCKIYESIQIKTNKKVIIKSYPKQIFHNPESFEKIRKQLILLSQINCQYIIKPKKTYCSNNSLYIIQQYCQTTLENLLQFKHNINWSLLLIQSFFHQLLTAIQYLHSRRITHGNVDTNNILVKSLNAEIPQLLLTGFSQFKDFSDNDSRGNPEVLYSWYQQTESSQSSSKCFDLSQLGYVLTAIIEKMEEKGEKEKEKREGEEKGKNQYEEGQKLAKQLVGKLKNNAHGQKITAEEALDHTFFKLNFS